MTTFSDMRRLYSGLGATQQQYIDHRDDGRCGVDRDMERTLPPALRVLKQSHVSQAVELLMAALCETVIMREDPDQSSYTPSEFEDDVTNAVLILEERLSLDQTTQDTPRKLQNDIRAIALAQDMKHFAICCPYCSGLVAVEYSDDGDREDQQSRCQLCGRTIAVMSSSETGYTIEVLDLDEIDYADCDHDRAVYDDAAGCFICSSCKQHV